MDKYLQNLLAVRDSLWNEGYQDGLDERGPRRNVGAYLAGYDRGVFDNGCENPDFLQERVDG